jgi:hypothetical protein
MQYVENLWNGSHWNIEVFYFAKHTLRENDPSCAAVSAASCFSIFFFYFSSLNVRVFAFIGDDFSRGCDMESHFILILMKRVRVPTDATSQTFVQSRENREMLLSIKLKRDVSLSNDSHFRLFVSVQTCSSPRALATRFVPLL